MSTKLTTGKVRFSYVNIFEPKAPQGGGDPVYSITLLIPKNDTATVQKINAAMKEARDNFCSKNGASAIPVQFNHTMHDGDGVKDSGESYGAECKGCYVISVKSKQRPLIIDNFKQDITDPGQVYSGCYGRAVINFYGYSRQGKKGVSASLLGIQMLSEGEPLGTMATADDFNDGFTDADGGNIDFM